MGGYIQPKDYYWSGAMVAHAGLMVMARRARRRG